MKARAFTLVELLVVIAILAVLSALGIGAASMARDKGDIAKCVSNLRQLTAAVLAYAADNGGQYVPAQDEENLVRWHGVRSGLSGRFDPQRGPLAPYLGERRRIKLCPALRGALTGLTSFEDGTGGYGYNATYIGGTPRDPYTPERLANVPAPARTLMFADTAFPRTEGVQEYAYAEPWQWADYAGRLRGSLAPSIHFRHGGMANIAFCDGHVQTEKPTRLGGKNRYGGDAAKWQIGWPGPEQGNGWWVP